MARTRLTLRHHVQADVPFCEEYAAELRERLLEITDLMGRGEIVSAPQANAFEISVLSAIAEANNLGALYCMVQAIEDAIENGKIKKIGGQKNE